MGVNMFVRIHRISAFLILLGATITVNGYSVTFGRMVPAIVESNEYQSSETISRNDEKQKKDKKERNKGSQKNKNGKNFTLPIPEGIWPVASLLVARPGDTTIDVSILASEEISGYIEYWEKNASSSQKTGEQVFSPESPSIIRLSELKKDTAYRYKLVYRTKGLSAYTSGPEYSFHTQRVPGSTYIVEIQGDSHPERDKQNNPVLYAQTLRSASDDKPDFYITLGDDFSVDTLANVSKETVSALYRSQRYYFGLVGHSAPVFLVNGNHEQAALYNLNGTPDNVAVWAQNAREKYFSQPSPENIYSGNSEIVPYIGLLRNYYAWTWGDALFVVIDPYWHTSAAVDNVFGGDKKNRDSWDITLGDAQYSWLRDTLKNSTAKFKFVFAHHVNGTGRGGTECAGFYEWGGYDRKGTYLFASKRPGWEMPIHRLFVQYGVTIFFQGHDHLFCKQERDGVVYQTIPEPGDSTYTLYNNDAYTTGDALPNTGRIRMSVSPEKVVVEYVRSFLEKDVTAEHSNNEVAYSYRIYAKKR